MIVENFVRIVRFSERIETSPEMANPWSFYGLRLAVSQLPAI